MSEALETMKEYFQDPAELAAIESLTKTLHGAAASAGADGIRMVMASLCLVAGTCKTVGVSQRSATGFLRVAFEMTTVRPKR